jgi:mannosyl-oligosaccharide glucosidase
MAAIRQLACFLLFCIFNVLFLSEAVVASDETIPNSEIGRLNNQSLLWGPYRPNLYFGVRPRIPKSLMAGLMWGKIEAYDGFPQSGSSPSLLRSSPC